MVLNMVALLSCWPDALDTLSFMTSSSRSSSWRALIVTCALYKMHTFTYCIQIWNALTGKNLATCVTWLAQTPFTEVGTFPPLYKINILINDYHVMANTNYTYKHTDTQTHTDPVDKDALRQWSVGVHHFKIRVQHLAIAHFIHHLFYPPIWTITQILNTIPAE